MNDEGMKKCQKCGRIQKIDNFYTNKDGSKTDLCKQCLTMHIDNFNPETFLWLLEKMDIPYIPDEWNVLRDRAFAKDPAKMNGMSVFGKYLSKMKLKQWNHYGWADSEKIMAQKQEKLIAAQEAQENYDALIKQQFEEGQISEAEYKTLTTVESQNAAFEYGVPIDKVGGINNSNFYNEQNFIAQNQLPDPAADLTDEDKIYLAMKWGRLYQPGEWIELERKYNEMMDSFDIQDSDTMGTLILTCKTFLKMNQAIDSGDLDGYQKLSRVYDSMRKSAKFTAAQNKESKENFVDSVGSLVAYCEKAGGKIPKYEIKTDYDIIDKIIRDLKDYYRSLIYEDPSLAQQVEDYIKKCENAEAMKRDKEEAKAKGRDEVIISDEDYQKHFEQLEQDRNQDQQIYYEKESVFE